MAIGSRKPRVDAYDKVTGRARYTGDLCPPDALTVRLVRSAVANGLVREIDASAAEGVQGVLRVVTCFEAPDRPFPTAGHPWSVEKSHQDISDRYILTKRPLVYGDEIAAVIAEDNVAAERAVRLVRVKYDALPALVSPLDAMEEGAPLLHPEYPGNVLKHSLVRDGSAADWESALAGEDCREFEASFKTQTVQHCHLEPPITVAWMESGRVSIITSTQIPHIVRRVVAQATGLSYGDIRVVKPYIGGGFGNKQDVLYEPLAAFLATLTGGRPVRIELTREETFANTRVRHAEDFKLRAAVTADGRILARKIELISNQGGYASHGHAVAANGASGYRIMYPEHERYHESDVRTVFTNIAAGGAMRAYGIPQIAFAMESHMDDMALALGIDPIDFRLKNCMKPGYKAPGTGITCHSSGLEECVARGRELIGWDEKRIGYVNQSGALRRGVGMAIFCYKTGVYPISLETASARLVLNQDGTAQLQMGAAEIGQGADTVFCQMAAATTGLREEDIRVVSMQDTDLTPFDTGAYASRQCYVSGMALKKTCEVFREKLLQYACWLTGEKAEALDIAESAVVSKESGGTLLTVSELAAEAFYSLKRSCHITAEQSVQCFDNTFSFGACFADVEVDMPLGRVTVKKLISVLDSGVIINPALAEGQAHGGLSMGLGYAFGEQLLYDNNARPLNGNFLDYKLPTALDSPDLYVEFADIVDPTGPYGNKSLGENPVIAAPPAVRNAILHATGVGIAELPMNPERLTGYFAANGLI